MKPTVLVLGSGPIRIGQGIEFDYSCVHCIWTLRDMGYRGVIINNNPETVSTDFDTADALYFEPVTAEEVIRVVRREKPIGVVTQFGGQTAINLAQRLHESGVTVLGTSPASIAAAEDRDQFDALMVRLGLPKPAGAAVRSLVEAKKVAKKVGYPVLVRPSFVLGGRAMEIVHEEAALEPIFAEAEAANPGQPVLVDKYLLGREAEVDVICDGETAVIPGLMEHIERAGVHSGDSMAVYPPVTLSPSIQGQMVTSAIKIARELGIRGLMNIQFVIQDDVPYVLEVNPRASRTVPYLSKVTDVPMIKLGTLCMMGEKLKDHGYVSGLCHLGPNGVEILPEERFASGENPIPEPKLYAVKAPVFSFQKLAKVEPSLGPEMKSTGEILGIDFEYEAALYKALVGSGIQFKPNGFVVVSVADADKSAAIRIGKELVGKGYPIAATAGTHDALAEAGIRSTRVNKIQDGSPNLLDLCMDGSVSLMINTPSPGQQSNDHAARIRRACIETGVACITNIDTAQALARALEYFERPERVSCLPYHAYLERARRV